MTTITISAKCSDKCFISSEKRNYIGYMPTEVGDSNYLVIEVNTKSGNILNWDEYKEAILSKLGQEA